MCVLICYVCVYTYSDNNVTYHNEHVNACYNTCLFIITRNTLGIKEIIEVCNHDLQIRYILIPSASPLRFLCL